MIHDKISRHRSPMHRRPGWRGGVAAALAIAIVTVTVTAIPVRAEVRVEGDAQALRIDASQSPVADVLSALGSTFPLRVNTSVVLDRRVSGTFTGSLAQVLSRLLEGYNYVIKRQASSTVVTVIGMRGDRAVAVEPARPAPARSLAAEWRGMTGNTDPRNGTDPRNR